MPFREGALDTRSPYRRGMKIVVTSRSGAPDPVTRHQIEAIDQSLRQSFAGLDTDEIEPEIKRSFAHLSVQPSTATIAAYAQAIRSRQDFELLID